MIWLILAFIVMVGLLLIGVALCRSSARGDEYQRMKRDHRDFWQG